LNQIAARQISRKHFFHTTGPSPRYRAEMELPLASLVNERLAVAPPPGGNHRAGPISTNFGKISTSLK
jgi:hypothetical protein